MGGKLRKPIGVGAREKCMKDGRGNGRIRQVLGGWERCWEEGTGVGRMVRHREDGRGVRRTGEI